MSKGIPMKTHSVWQRGKWLWAAASVSALAACFGGGGSTTASSSTPTAPYQNPVLTGVTPVVAVIGVPATFTVTGQNFPLTASASLANGSCLTPANRAATGFTVVCTPGGVAGDQIMTITSDTVANSGWWIGMQTIAVSAASAATVSGLLTDTGITASQCYAAGSDVLVSCSNSAALALNDKQDGMTGRDVLLPDMTDGNLGMSYSTVGAFEKTECVKDNISGLTWQGKTATLLALPGDARSQEAKAYEASVNVAGLCGYTNWRLPTRLELQSLVNYGAVDPNAAMDAVWLPDTKSGAYFSISPYAPNVKNVWVVDFIKGSVINDGAINSGVYVRLVR